MCVRPDLTESPASARTVGDALLARPVICRQEWSYDNSCLCRLDDNQRSLAQPDFNTSSWDAHVFCVDDATPPTSRRRSGLLRSGDVRFMLYEERVRVP